MTVEKGGSTPSPSPTGGSDAQSQALAQIMGALGGTASAGAGKVYMGQKAAPSPLAGKDLTNLTPQAQSNLLARGAGKKVDSWLSTTDAEDNYYTWSAKQRRDFIAKGLLGGLLTQGAGDLEGAQLWKQLVDAAAGYGAKGVKMSPLDILAGYVKGNSSGGWVKSSDGQFETNPVTGEKRYIGPKFKTTTQTNADLTDPATARATAVAAFQSLLGRDPGQGEIDAYAQALTQAEEQNPQTATTTTQYDPTTGEPTDASTVTTGGMTDQGREQLAEDAIKKKKEYGATQAATTYMNALESAVGGGS